MGRRKSINRWQLHDAKARLSELVRLAAACGPQEITVRGEPAAVVLSPADYDRLRRDEQKAQNLSDFLLASPLAGLDLEFERDHSAARCGPLMAAVAGAWGRTQWCPGSVCVAMSYSVVA